MRKTKGFTLIELLAVIVVLAIIALIAIPIVMNVIKSSKKGTAERSADNYVRAVELAIATEELDRNYVIDGTYKINSDGNLEGEGLTEPLKIEMNGTKPNNGIIVIENGLVQKTSYIKIGDYYVQHDNDRNSFVASLEYQGIICTKTEEVDLSTLNYGDAFTCELGDNDEKTFYVLEQNEDTISLIMNMNIDENGKGTTSGSTVAWPLDGSNENGSVTALAYLESSTKGWIKLNSKQISLPSGQQIANAGGDTEWTDSKCTTNILSAWLYENLHISGAPYTYWTSTPRVSSSDVWYVSYHGYLSYVNADNGITSGVRPIITLSKAQLG